MCIVVLPLNLGGYMGLPRSSLAKCLRWSNQWSGGQLPAGSAHGTASGLHAIIFLLYIYIYTYIYIYVFSYGLFHLPRSYPKAPDASLIAVASKKLEHGCGLVHAGAASLFRWGLEDGHVPTFWPPLSRMWLKPETNSDI